MLFNPLESRGNYSATSSNMKLVHWPLVSGLLHLVQRGGDWAVPQPAQAPPHCTKCNSPPIDVETDAQRSTCRWVPRANFGDSTTFRFRFMGHWTNTAQTDHVTM